MQTLSSGWNGPFIVTEKVSVVDYRIQLGPERSSKMVHVDELFLDPCHQERTNWIRNELTRRTYEKVINMGMTQFNHNRQHWV